MYYLQQKDHAFLCIFVRCYVEHAGPVSVHDPVVHLRVGTDISIGRFNSGHHRLERQWLRHRELITLWGKEKKKTDKMMLVMDVLISLPTHLHNAVFFFFCFSFDLTFCFLKFMLHNTGRHTQNKAFTEDPPEENSRGKQHLFRWRKTTNTNFCFWMYWILQNWMKSQ